MVMNWTIIIVEGLMTAILGSILHFTYELCHRNKFVAIFSAVNESTWEHIKLALSGIFFCTLVDIWILGDNPNYWLARSFSMIMPILVIPAFFYGYRVVTGWRSCLPLDIGIFFLASFVSSIVFAMFLDAPDIGLASQLVSIILAIVIFTSYLLLTRFPLHHNFLFQDPITGGYGYEAVATHRERRQIRKIQKSEQRNQVRTKPGEKYWRIDQIPEAKPATKQTSKTRKARTKKTKRK